jgi:predicted MFS family arabinose efflux permease
MFLLVIFALNVCSVPLLRGRLSRLATLRFRWLPLLSASLATQLLVLTVLPGGHDWLYGPVHVATYVMVAVFLVVNRHIPGLWLVGLGGALNLAAIVANGGVMPAAPGALDAAGLLADPTSFANSAAVADPRLRFLGDVFAIPRGWPLSNVFSIGDILLLLGAVLILHRVCGSRLLPPASREFLALGRHHGFLRLWGAQTVSSLGDWVFTLAVVASIAERGGAHVLATLVILQVGPAAVAGLLVGPWVDRWPRTLLMVGADAARGLAVASLLLGEPPSLGRLYTVAVVLGLAGALFQPSLYASIPNLVGRGEILAANAALSATFHLAIAVGPLLGGLVVTRFGPMPAFAVNAASFGVSALLVASVRMRRAVSDVDGEPSPVRALVDGLRYAATTPLVRGVLIVTGLLMTAAAMKSPLEPLFVLRVLGEPATALGLLGGMWGLGMLLGSVSAPGAANLLSRERLLWVSITIVGLCVLGASRAQALTAILPLWLVAGAANAVGSVAYETLLQERTTDSLRGRVLAASEATLDAAYLVGVFAAGWLGTALGIRATYAIAGGAFLVAALTSRVLLPVVPRGAATRALPPHMPSSARVREGSTRPRGDSGDLLLDRAPWTQAR